MNNSPRFNSTLTDNDNKISRYKKFVSKEIVKESLLSKNHSNIEIKLLGDHLREFSESAIASQGESWIDRNPLDQVIEYYRRLQWQAILYENFVIRAARKKDDGSFENKIFLGKYCPNNELVIYSCKYFEDKKGKQPGDLVRYQKDKLIDNPIDYLRGLGQEGYNLYSLPNHVRPLSKECYFTLGDRNATKFNSLFYEIDNLNLEDQFKKLNWLCEKTGLIPSLIVFSGGKSIHVYFALNEDISSDQWYELNKHLTAIVEGDPAINTLSRQMRLPGVVRLKNGQLNEQSLIFSSNHQYSFSDIKKRFNQIKEFNYTPKKESTSNREKVTFPEDFTNQVIKYCLENIPERVPGSGTYEFYLKIITAIKEIVGDDLGREYISKYIPNMLYAFNSCKPKQFDLIFLTNVCKSLCDHLGIKWVLSNEIKRELYKAIATNPNPKNDQPAFESSLGLLDSEIDLDQHDPLDEYLDPIPNPINLESLDPDQALALWREQSKDKSPIRKFDFLAKDDREIITFDPDFDYTLEDLQGKIIECNNQDDILAAYLFLIRKGAKNILDSRDMGQGKTHNVAGLRHYLGILEGIDQIAYINPDYRNMDIQDYKLFTNLTARHNGLYFDHENGSISRNKSEHSEQIEKPTCPNSDLFESRHQKHFISINEGESDPICKACPHNRYCSEVQGFYRYERKKSQSNSLIKGDINGFKGLFEFEKKLAIFDEPGSSIKHIKSINARYSDLLIQLDKLEAVDDELYQKVKSLKFKIKTFIESKAPSRFGFDHDDIIRELKRDFTPLSNEEITKIIGVITPNFGEFLRESDGLNNEDRKGLSSAMKAVVNSYFRRDAKKDNKEALEALEVNILPYLLLLVSGIIEGEIKIKFDCISISLIDKELIDLIHSFNTRIFLDATSSNDSLARRLNLDPDSIFEVRLKKPDYSNLTIKVVSTKGLKTRNYSDKKAREIKQLIHTLGIDQDAVIDFKDGKISPYYWYRHSRKSNNFQGIERLLFIGLPNPNLGAARSEFRLSYGNLSLCDNLNLLINNENLLISHFWIKSLFNGFYDDRLLAELIQGVIGRQRSHRYPDKKFESYLIAPAIDLDCIKERYPGINIEYVDLADLIPINPIDKILASAQKLIGEGIKFSQENLSEFSGLSRSAIRRAIKGLSQGWEGLKSLSLRKYLESFMGDLYKLGIENFWELNYLGSAISKMGDRLIFQSLLKIFSNFGEMFETLIYQPLQDFSKLAAFLYIEHRDLSKKSDPQKEKYPNPINQDSLIPDQEKLDLCADQSLNQDQPAPYFEINQSQEQPAPAIADQLNCENDQPAIADPAPIAITPPNDQPAADQIICENESQPAAIDDDGIKSHHQDPLSSSSSPSSSSSSSGSILSPLTWQIGSEYLINGKRAILDSISDGLAFFIDFLGRRSAIRIA